MNLNNNIYKITEVIKSIIKEHNEIWGNISIAHRKYKTPKGYRCFNLSEENITTIAIGLDRKGIIIKE